VEKTTRAALGGLPVSDQHAVQFTVIWRLAGGPGTPVGCVTVTVCPPAVTVALRDAGVEFEGAVSVIVPLPDPLAPLVTVSHVALLVAVHVQPAPAVTVTLPVPPAATTLCVAGDSA